MTIEVMEHLKDVECPGIQCSVCGMKTKSTKKMTYSQFYESARRLGWALHVDVNLCPICKKLKPSKEN